MNLLRPALGWKRYLDPATWAGIQQVADFALGVFPLLGGGRRLNHKTPSGQYSGLIFVLADGAAVDVDWVLNDGTPTILPAPSTGVNPDPDGAPAIAGGQWAQVPEGKIWLVPYASAEHDDTGVLRYVTIFATSAGNSGRVYLADAAINPSTAPASVGYPSRVYLDRPILLRAGCSLGVSVDGLTATKKTSLRYATLELLEDEPIPWL